MAISNTIHFIIGLPLSPDLSPASGREEKSTLTQKGKRLKRNLSNIL
jgi:hypothetical protein